MEIRIHFLFHVWDWKTNSITFLDRERRLILFDCHHTQGSGMHWKLGIWSEMYRRAQKRQRKAYMFLLLYWTTTPKDSAFIDTNKCSSSSLSFLLFMWCMWCELFDAVWSNDINSIFLGSHQIVYKFNILFFQAICYSCSFDVFVKVFIIIYIYVFIYVYIWQHINNLQYIVLVFWVSAGKDVNVYVWLSCYIRICPSKHKIQTT